MEKRHDTVTTTAHTEPPLLPNFRETRFGSMLAIVSDPYFGGNKSACRLEVDVPERLEDKQRN